jgi:hypothetical protein
MDQDVGGVTVKRAYAGESDGLIVIRTRYGPTNAVVFFKANLPSTWDEEERLNRLDAVFPMIEAAAAREFGWGRFTDLRALSSQLDDAVLIILGWGDLVPENQHQDILI